MSLLVEERCSPECALDPTASAEERAALMLEYLQETNERLQAMSELVGAGETIGPDSHDWILAQVDFLVATIDSDHFDFDGEIRSNLLQLLLALANLNEQIRHQASVAR